MRKNKKILFLSALDFKEKSIQVIKKTPEAFSKKGWDVFYVVIRDNSKSGNYFYEKEIDPEGIKVYRDYLLFSSIKDRINNKIFLSIVSKILGYLTIIQLVLKGYKILKQYDIDVIYGYEIHGVLAKSILNLIFFYRKFKLINRFQGTWITHYIKTKNYIKLILNIDAIIAMRTYSDLCIMTDDGTQGDYALKILKSKSLKNFKFWINGVDKYSIKDEDKIAFKKRLGITNEHIFVSISRLESWKRVDRCLHIISKVKKLNIKYFIVGDGYMRNELENLAKELKIESKVFFVGAIPHNEVIKYLSIADYFLSFYDLSNVGNPLLEAIRFHKIIFTLNNGDTSKWIQHKKNGFIYDINKDLYNNVAKDIYNIIDDNKFQQTIIENIQKTEKEKLWDWEERLNKEVKEVEKLFESKI